MVWHGSERENMMWNPVSRAFCFKKRKGRIVFPRCNIKNFRDFYYEIITNGLSVIAHNRELWFPAMVVAIFPFFPFRNMAAPWQKYYLMYLWLNVYAAAAWKETMWCALIKSVCTNANRWLRNKRRVLLYGSQSQSIVEFIRVVLIFSRII